MLILDAACPLGVGSPRWLELLKEARTHAEALEVIRKRGYRLSDHKAVSVRRLQSLRGVRLALVVGTLDPGLSEALGISVFDSRREAATWAANRLDAESNGVVVEDAGNTVVGLCSAF